MERLLAPLWTFGSSSDSGVTTALSGILLVVVGFGMYFLPCVVAAGRRVHRVGGIAVLNILLGWTVIGWIGALLWAVSAETEQEAKLRETALSNMAQMNRLY